MRSWDFAAEDTHYMTHGLHMYPARMIPQIAANLIRLYGRKNGLVLDPFCGSGGVLLEATRANMQSIGLDINPLACLISRVKSNPINPTKLSNAWKILKANLIRDITGYRFRQVRPAYTSDLRSNVTYWFKQYMIDELMLIKNNIDSIPGKKIKEFFYVCFSNTIRTVSGTRKGEFKLYRMPIEKWKTYNPDVLRTFEQKVDLALSMVGEFYDFIKTNNIHVRSEIFQVDARDLLEVDSSNGISSRLYEGSVDLLVTSPPYGDSHTTVAYGQFSRYSLLLMGYPYQDVLDIDKESLGGRKNNELVKSKTLDKLSSQISNTKRRQEVYDFFKDLAKSLDKISRVLSNGAYACFVLGNRTVNGVKISTDEILIELARDCGLSRLKVMHRNIPMKRMPRINSPSNVRGKTLETITKECIIVLRK